MLLDRSRLTIKFANFGTAPATALSDPLLLSRVQAFRRMLGARMMALDKPTAKKKIPSGDYHISRKIDGEFTVLIVRDGEAITLNPGGTVRAGTPMLEEALQQLSQAGVQDAIIAGELYVQRPDGKRPRVHDVVRVARKPETQEDLQSLAFAVFDIIELDGQEYGSDYNETWEKITSLFDGGAQIHPVETISGNEKAILEQFETWVEDGGAEGVVARSEAAGMFKIKPRHTLDAVVIGFTESVEDRAGMLHDMLLAILRRDGSFQVLGRVGGGFTDENRVDFLSDLNDIIVDSDYAEVNSDRVAYQMVEPKLVVEISCLDLVAQTTRGGSIDRMVLNWNAQVGKWETLRRLPLVSIISPQFVRFREDKSVTPEDLRIDQLTDLVEIPMSEKSADELELPKSDIMRRKVATKTLKGAQMVRKLLLWKTNKESESEAFPAFVIHLTDYSPNRKVPLQREIRVSNSQEQIGELWDSLDQKYFVKGWVEV